MTRDTKILRAMVIAMILFSTLLVVSGAYAWYTTGRIVPLGPGVMMLSSALCLMAVLRNRK
ncbi:MAG: hypothetical protein SGJ19_01700 [Planctomycetia bacterium]|nr:hypothetical protein [Planctomycetia bacterium]